MEDTLVHERERKEAECKTGWEAVRPREAVAAQGGRVESRLWGLNSQDGSSNREHEDVGLEAIESKGRKGTRWGDGK